MSEQTTSLPIASRPRSIDARFSRFLSGVFIMVVALYVLPFALLRLPRTGTMFHHDLDYAFDRAGDNADIVILGDSTALHSVNPVEVASALHLKTVNLPNTIGSLIVDGDMELQRYLQTNKRPHLIVFYLAAWNLNYTHGTTPTKLYEGDHMLLRHGTAREILTFARQNTARLLEFSFRFYSVATTPNWLANLLHETQQPQTTAASGYEPDLTMSSLDRSCVLPTLLSSQVGGTDTAKELLNKYRGVADHVMVYVAPVPACSGAQAVTTAHSYADILALPPKLMNPEYFVNDEYYAHIRGDASPKSSKIFIETIRSMLAPNSPGTSPSAPS